MGRRRLREAAALVEGVEVEAERGGGGGGGVEVGLPARVPQVLARDQALHPRRRRHVGAVRAARRILGAKASANANANEKAQARAGL